VLKIEKKQDRLFALLLYTKNHYQSMIDN